MSRPLRAALCAVVAILACAPAASGATFSPSMKLSDSGDGPSRAELSVGFPGNAIAGWDREAALVDATLRPADGDFADDATLSGAESSGVDVATSEQGTVAIAWRRDVDTSANTEWRLEVRVRNAGENAFGAVKNLGQSVALGPPQIGVDSTGRVVVGWVQEGNVRVRTRQVGAADFDAPLFPAGNNAAGIYDAQMETYGDGGITAAWARETGANKSALQAARKDPGQAGFAAVETLDESTTSGFAFDGLRLGTSAGGQAAFAWINGRGTPAAKARGTWRNSAAGTFVAAKDLSTSGGADEAPDADAHNNGAWFTWSNKGAGDRHTTHSREASFGSAGFVSPDTNLSGAEDSDISTTPSVALNAAGGVVIASRRQAGSTSQILAATGDSSGAPLTKDTVEESQFDVTSPRAGIDSDGVATVLWIDGDFVKVSDDREVGSPVSFANEYEMSEGAPADFLRLRRPAGGAPGSVDLIRTGGTSTGADYTIPTGNGVTKTADGWRIQFADGETSKDVAVNVVNDTTDEGDESLTVGLVNPRDNASLGLPSTKATKIFDNDTPRVTVADDDVIEGDTSAEDVRLRFAVSLSKKTVRPVQFTFSTQPGSADASDFNPVTDRQVVVPTGESSAEIVVQVTEDTAKELDENLKISLANYQHIRPGTKTTATGTIANDDGITSGAQATPPSAQVAESPPLELREPSASGGIFALAAPSLVATPAQRIRRTLRLPDFRAGSTDCRLRRTSGSHGRVCDMTDIEEWIAKKKLSGIRLVERNGDLDNVLDWLEKSDSSVRKRLRNALQEGDIIATLPEPRAKISEPNLAFFPASKPFVIRVLTYHDPQLQVRCGSGELAGVLKDQLWPGVTTGRGTQRRYGAQDLLDRIDGCPYEVVRHKVAGATSATVRSVDIGRKIMRVHVEIPRTLELRLIPFEGAYDRRLDEDVVGPFLPRGDESSPSNTRPSLRMPTTSPGLGQLVVLVEQTSGRPTMAVPGRAHVTLYDPHGLPVADGYTDGTGRAVLKGEFAASGTYTLDATYVGTNGLTLDGVGELRVSRLGEGEEIVTPAGRRFGRTKKRWERLPNAPVRAQNCPGGGGDEQARFVVAEFQTTLRQIQAAPTPWLRRPWIGRFVNTYLGALDAGILTHQLIQAFLNSAKVAVINAGTGELRPVTCLGRALTISQAYAVAGSGFDIGRSPVPAIATPNTLVLVDGTQVGAFRGDTTIFNADQLSRGFQLTPDQRLLALEAVLYEEGVSLDVIQHLASAGVIASGGGNVIASGGGNVIASGGGNLTLGQLRAVLTVIAKAPISKVIASGGGNFSQRQRETIGAVIQYGSGNVIASGGGNVIASGGGNLTEGQVRALLNVVNSGGQHVIASGGGNVIASGGGNVIASGGGNVIASGGGNVIASGGGNLTGLEKQLINQVIASGGGNVIASGGGNVIASGGGNILSGTEMLDAFEGVVGYGNGNLSTVAVKGVQSVIASGGGNVIASGGGNIAEIQQTLQGAIDRVVDKLEKSEVIASGGGNVIASGGGNVIASGGGNVIASGGGNVIASGGGNILADLKALSKVIASGGGNVIASGGGNVIASGGGNVIASGGGNIMEGLGEGIVEVPNF